MKKIIALPISLLLLTAIGATVTAEGVTDPTGDVYHWQYSGGTYGWDTNIGNKPNIDITDISYSVSGEQVTLTLTVAGSIIDSELISYWAYVNTSDSNYMFSWNNGESMGWGTNTQEGSFEMDFEPEITASGNTITAIYNLIGTFQTGIEVWGWAAEYTSYGNTAEEWWADWAPESYSWYEGEGSGGDSGDTGGDDTSGDDSEGDDTGGDISGDNDDSGDTGGSNDDGSNTNTPPPSGTPGFGLLAMITAFAAIVLILRKRS